jgi:hypothetical protein
MARWKFLANLLSLTAVSLMTPRQEACIFNSVLEREVEEIVEILLGFLAFRLFTGCSIPGLGCKQSPKRIRLSRQVLLGQLQEFLLGLPSAGHLWGPRGFPRASEAPAAF